MIQAYAIPKIVEENESNSVFQSMNGSGKTGAFAIPAIMRVDTSLNDTQVIIIGGTSRELNR